MIEEGGRVRKKGRREGKEGGGRNKRGGRKEERRKGIRRIGRLERFVGFD